jgi:hypothetical protein
MPGREAGRTPVREAGRTPAGRLAESGPGGAARLLPFKQPRYADGACGQQTR